MAGKHRRNKKRSRRASDRLKKISRKQPLHELLEQRQLLDASGLLQAVDSSTFSEEHLELVTEASEPIVFVDSAVDDHEALLKDAASGAEVVFLKPGHDGIEQIAAVLATRSNVPAIHIVSHGDAGQLQLGNATLTTESMAGEHADELTTIRRALSESADILIYGCNFGQGEAGYDAANRLSKFTGADVAASDDPTGPTALGGDWNFEVTVGDIESRVVVSPYMQQNMSSTLQLVGFSALVASDGTPSYDTDDNPGNDSGPNNGIIRSHDIVTFNVDFSTDSGGATNPTIKATLPDGLIWETLPAVGTGANSGIFDSVTGAPGGDQRSIVIHLPDIAGALSTSIPVQARALGYQDGTPLNGIQFTMCADELGATELASAEMDLEISSAPFMDIQLEAPTFRGVHNNPSTGKEGAVYSYSLGILGNHPTRSGTDAVKGSAPIEDPFTFDMDMSNVSPGAELFTWGPSIGVYNSDDGINRNYERGTNGTGGAINLWSRSNRPVGRTGEHTTATWEADRSTPDSGDATIGAGTPGGTYPITVTGADTDGPLPTEYANGSPIPAGQGWFASYIVHVWIPICDIDLGEDGLAGTDDDGALDIVPAVTNFDPDDYWNDQNNYGAGVEDPSNNDHEHTVVSNSLGGPVKRLFEYDRWSWVETSSFWYAGDGVTSPGHQYDVGIHSGQNLGVLPQSGLIWGDKFDNTATKIIPISDQNGQGGQWSRLHSNQAGWTFTYGVDYIIEFGTGGVGGAAGGWTDWNSMDQVTVGDCSPTVPTDPYVPALEHTVPLIMVSLREEEAWIELRVREQVDIDGARHRISASASNGCCCDG